MYPRAVAVLISLLPVFILVAVPVAIAAIFLWSHSACFTQVRHRISNLSGLDFEISETMCHTLVVDDAISVFASHPDGRERILLFKYDPGGDVPLPVITSAPPRKIKISVPWISSIQVRRQTWDDLTIEYDIGRIDYPGPERSQ